MMFKNKKALKSIVLGLALVMVLGVGAVAANQVTEKQITAVYGGINLNFEGKNVTQEVEDKYGTRVMLVDDRTYIPVRALAEVLGLSIDYRFDERTAYITDPKTSELIAKDKKIEELEKEVKRLEKELDKVKEEEVSKDELKDIEKDLNKEYGNYKRLTFDIKLSEKANYIQVDMNTKFKTTSDRMDWIDMSYNNKRILLEDITDVIAKAYPKEDIRGTIYDSYDNTILAEFTRNAGKSLAITSLNDGGTLDAKTEDIIIDEFYYYGIRDSIVDKYTEGRREANIEISFTSRYEPEWKKMREEDVLSLFNIIARELERNYIERDVDTVIKLYMNSSIVAEYSKPYNGSGKIDYLR